MILAERMEEVALRLLGILIYTLETVCVCVYLCVCVRKGMVAGHLLKSRNEELSKTLLQFWGHLQ